MNTTIARLLTAILVATSFAGSAQADTITGAADDTSGVYLFSAGEDSCYCGWGQAAGEPTDDIISAALGHGILTYLGDEAAEIVNFTTGPREANDAGARDSTTNAVIEGLTEIDDFGMIANGSDNSANFDSGHGGHMRLSLADPLVIQADGIVASGTLGPDGAGSEAAAEAALDGFEIFIFEGLPQNLWVYFTLHDVVAPMAIIRTV